MPKETLSIRTFNGVVGSADAHDLPEGTAAYAENLDMTRKQHVFAPLPDDSSYSGANAYGHCDNVVVFDDGDHACLVDQNVDHDADGGTPVVDVARIVDLTSSMSNTADSLSLAASGLSRPTRDCISSMGQSVRVGLGSDGGYPLWGGYIFHKQFNIAFSPGFPGYQFYRAKLDEASAVGAVITNGDIAVGVPAVQDTGPDVYDTSDVAFESHLTYHWYASYVYDNNQEGPLNFLFKLNLATSAYEFYGFTGNTATNLSTGGGNFTSTIWETIRDAVIAGVKRIGLRYVQVKLRVRTDDDGTGNDTIPRRVTGINIYRSEGVNTTDVETPQGTPYFVKYIDINDAGWTAGVSGSGGTTAFDYSSGGSTEVYSEYTFKDEGYSFESYEDRVGLSPNLKYQDLKYGLSCVVDGYHIVGDVAHSLLNDTKSMLMRSKPFRPDTFDWSNDFVTLPIEPQALFSWNSRVFAMGKGRTLIVNPYTLEIEETLNGIGVSSQRSGCVTEAGLFWADENNIYHHDGARIHFIGTPVLKNIADTSAGWLNRQADPPPVMGFDAVYESLVIFFNDADDIPIGLMYHVPTKRWCYLTQKSGEGTAGWATATDEVRAMFNTNTGGLVYSASDTYVFRSLFTNAGNRQWKWISSQMGNFGAKAKCYHVYVGFTGTRPTVSFYDNDSTYSTAHAVSTWTTGVDSATIDKGQLTTTPGTWITFRELALQLVGTASQAVTNLSVIFRSITPR